MDSVLAIAALHIASGTSDPAESQSYIDSALDYHTAALTTSRERLSVSDSLDQDACVISSICILITATAYSNMSPEKNQRDQLDDILEKRTILRGTRFLIRRSEAALNHPLLTEWRFGNEPFDHSEPPENEVLQKLGEVKSELENSNHMQKEVLNSTYNLVEKAIRDWPVRAGEMVWVLEVSDEYIDMLRSGDWMARVLLMFYGLCLHLSSELWAIQDAGKRLVLSILPQKTQVPAEWVDCITWIRQALDR
ncbi:unnamed protein product [Penicillium manginii]